MRAAAALGVLCAVVAVAGCRATPERPPDDLGVDLAGGDDSGMDDFAVGGDMACAVGPEVCGNGCDDDRNGYTDDDDPACTSQMLVTLQFGTPALWRMVLEPTPHVVVLDGNPITTNGAMATYNATFSPAAFLAFDSGTKLLEKRPLGGGSATQLSTSYTTRDACVFNGELIVVDPRPTAGNGYLHRYKVDGQTELGMVPVANIPSACSSDGTMLYVSEHPSIGDSDIRVFAKSAAGPVDTGTTIAIPDGLANNGYTRLVDLAYLKKSGLFVGLFTTSTGSEGDVMAPFGLDGGVGNWIDGGVWHGVGEFVP